MVASLGLGAFFCGDVGDPIVLRGLVAILVCDLLRDGVFVFLYGFKDDVFIYPSLYFINKSLANYNKCNFHKKNK